MKYISASKWNELLDIDDSYKAPDALWAILRDKTRREELFRETLELHSYEVDYDWFHEYFQDEHADRANKKQDFTPNSVSKLLTELVGPTPPGGTYYEPAVGTGGIMITKWRSDCFATNFFEYRPSMFLYQGEELSDRAIPFLIFNLALRGMNASVVHGDVLTRKNVKGAFFIQNEDDNYLGFSNIYTMPYNEDSEEYFSVKFTDKESGRHAPIDEVGDFPAHLGGNEFLEAIRKSSADIVSVCGACGIAFADGVAFEYSPDHGDICEECSEVSAE